MMLKIKSLFQWFRSTSTTTIQKQFSNMILSTSNLRQFLTWTSWRLRCFPVAWQTLRPAMYALNRSSSVTSCSMQTLVSQSYFSASSDCHHQSAVAKFCWWWPHSTSNRPCWKDKVPLRQKSINELGARYYENPARFHTRIHVAISPDWHLSCDPQKVKPVSPVENVMGFVLPLEYDYGLSICSSQWTFNKMTNQ